ncbi:MAG: hypothetical protein Q8P18_22795 [Pseudomonadota bacterium]|nr:hypothetical protein [Pseudomonadota bacterium]
MLTLLLLPPAHAACAVEQTESAEGVKVVIRALEEPVGCRTVTLESDRPLTFAATLWSPEERRARLRDDHQRLLPGGGWEIGLPELVVGGRAELDVVVSGETLTVRLGPPEAPPPPASAHEIRTLTLDARHPGWGFADPTRASTRVELRLTFASDAAPESAPPLVPLPPGATEVDAGGLTPVPLGLLVPVGTREATIRYTVPGAEPLGSRALPAGSLTLVGPGVEWIPSPGPGVTATPVEGGIRFDAPSGGLARWRVARAGGAAVVPDAATFVAGLDWRFARLSLPEPAVPVSIRDRLNRPNLYAQLMDEVRALRVGALPGRDPLRPRQLNKAWQSGWATPVERALILHRFFGQEKLRAGWVVTGEHADPSSLTGFDTLLLTLELEGRTLWVDPSCDVCASGEVGTRWLGKPAVGAATAVPTAPGQLSRTLSLIGDQFHASFTASGAAALWVRERIAGVEPALRSERIAAALGMPGATLVSSTGFAEAGAPLTVELVATRAPRDPFDGDTPWAGGWSDVLAAAPPSP